MGRKKYTDNPAVDDTIIFDLNTENNDGMAADPFSVEKVTIFYLEKKVNDNSKKVEKKFYNPYLQKQYEEWKQITDTDPSLENINSLKNIKKKLDSTAKTTDVYYKEAQFVMSTLGPIWTKNGSVRKVVNFTDKNKKPIPGMFFFAWMPTDMREGDYIIRWEWRVEEHGKIKAAEKIFSISPSTKINAANVNLVPRDKYDFLLRKYIPAMYFVKTKPDDLTPSILEKLNKTVGQCFLEIEDMASNLFTLADTESIKADFLPLLANNFGLILRSDSTDAWRNQIRFASRLYKKKGTYEGLKQALDKAGIILLKLTNLWQVVSKCNWMDGFLIDKDINLDTQIIGYLAKKPINDDIIIDIRSSDNDEYLTLPKDIISFQEVQAPETKTAIVWQGGYTNPQIPLIKGDVLRIKYQYNKIPDNDAAIEKYIEELSLADQRDELKIKYPLKNWNIKIIEEDDPLFNLLVTERNPFYSPTVFGKIRTTFLYSEKVFNMDTYNGSLYNSNNPCHIDKDFVDTCNSGRSSKFNVYLEFDKVTDDKIKEAKEIIIDYSPFHAILHNIIISSKTFDYVLPPVESIKNDIKEDKNKERIGFGEAINCKIKYKDGRELEGII
jgi:hypothetical protein